MLRQFQVTNFRNLDQYHIFSFEKGLNFILGENAQGKTNLLEAIDLFLRGKSFRKSSMSELYSFDQQEPFISLKGIWKESLYTRYLFLEKKDTLKPLSHTFPIEPLNHFIFLKEEAKKRDWFDYHFSSFSFSFSKELTQVKKILFQKSYYLKNYQEKMIKILNEQLASKIFYLAQQKKKFIEEINPLLKQVFKNLFEEKKNLSIVFQSPFSSLKETESLLEKNLKEEFLTKKVARTLSLESYDYILDDKSVESFASLGQKKIAYLSTCFAILEIYKKIYEDYPVILFDDFSGEIDVQRERNLIEVLEAYPQVFLTTVDKRDYKNNRFFLKEGKVFHEERL